MSPKVSIRPIQTDEIDQLIKISKQCFHQTFDPWRALEDVNTYIQRAYTRCIKQFQWLKKNIFIVYG